MTHDEEGHDASTSRRGGQAVVEFVVGLIVVLALCAGLMQIASLTKAHTDAMVEARRLAAEQATVDLGSDTPSSAEYILKWRPDADGKPYTRDDQHSDADPGAFRERIVGRASANSAGWDSIIDLVPADAISRLHGSDAPSSLFGLVNGSAPGSVEVLPEFRKLIYDAATIDVGCEVWMTRTKGLY